MLTLSFTLQNILILEGRTDTLFTTTIEKDANANHILTTEDGLQFAIGIVDFYSDDEDALRQKLDDKINLYVYQWFYSSDSTKEVPESFEMETHLCTDEELGLIDNSEPSTSKFYPHSKSSLETLKSKGTSQVFYCFDQDQIQLMNDITSSEAYRLAFYFDIPLEMCQN